MAHEPEEVPGSRAERLSPQRKLELVLGSYSTDNLAEYARSQGVDRSYLYQLRREVEQGALEAWAERKPGRPAKDEPSAAELGAENDQLRRRLAEAQEAATAWELKAGVNEIYLRAAEAAVAEKKGGPGRPHQRLVRAFRSKRKR